KSLIGNYCARGDYAKVEALAEEAIASFEAARLRLGFAGLDRALRTTDITPLPGVAVAAARRKRPDIAWQALERNMARGLWDHLAAQAAGPEERALLEKLSLLDRQLNELRGRGANTETDKEQFKKTEADRNAAQARLVEFQSSVVAKGGATAGQVYELARI